jgi:hypothetical protein
MGPPKQEPNGCMLRLSINITKELQMRTSIILLLVLLTVTACAPRQPAAPITSPDLPGYPEDATAVPSGTAEPECTCPNRITPPPQPPAGKVSPDHGICNCPVILVPPSVTITGFESTPQAVPSDGITLVDNGKTFIVHPDESFLLSLGMDIYDWTVSIDDQNVLSREKNVMPIRGAQGVYQAGGSGQAVLSAVGDPLCRNSTPACMLPSLIFKVTVIVQ